MPFKAGGKSLDATILENGDLLVVGYAAVWDGLDREGENFLNGAFQRGIKTFLEGQATLAFHHQHDKGIGKVLELREDERGLWMKARVDFQPESSPLRYIYNGIKKGTYNALSVGGFFARTLTARGWRISAVDVTEVSVTPVPAHPGTSFAVVAGKALDSAAASDIDAIIHDARMLMLEAQLERARYQLADLIVNGAR
ncbi:HK97 family phage prohead protease [Conexibacter arvalis]|uniref:HK97 family phage prohead protease n=1 Tax=Conexibacter arvalis TaxID=912552 RepID=A0A840IDI4_9ACTN|nr:HK97 family phage prohead protease [Conexibacter arvalis]MBB4663017.1 HK97 family phage prohead protease [Conexibacter arvalis]